MMKIYEHIIIQWKRVMRDCCRTTIIVSTNTIESEFHMNITISVCPHTHKRISLVCSFVAYKSLHQKAMVFKQVFNWYFDNVQLQFLFDANDPDSFLWLKHVFHTDYIYFFGFVVYFWLNVIQWQAIICSFILLYNSVKLFVLWSKT